jgi:release factor glutamine methyltransferase
MTPDEKWLLEEKYGGEATPAYKADRKRLEDDEPLAYVIGYQPFLGLKIYLDSKPLIPRVETEWWTDRLLQQFGTDRSGVFRSATARGAAIFQQENTRPPTISSELSFLDLCAGSGAIGCAALARLPEAQVYFSELEEEHRPTILKNIRENGLDESRAHIGIGDLFEPFGEEQFDVIAANPPYIPLVRALPASIVNYEPKLALYGGDDGLALIRRIASALPKHLKKGGIAWIECDSAHASQACALFEETGFTAEIRSDQYGNPRIIVVSWAHA